MRKIQFLNLPHIPEFLDTIDIWEKNHDQWALPTKEMLHDCALDVMDFRNDFSISANDVISPKMYIFSVESLMYD